MNEEKDILIQQYIGLLDTIDEAFGHILGSLEKMRLNDAEHVWDDVSMALMQIRESNQVLAEHFMDQPKVLFHFFRFETVMEKTRLLQYADHHVWKKIIEGSIYPAFSEWLRHLTADLRPDIIH